MNRKWFILGNKEFCVPSLLHLFTPARIFANGKYRRLIREFVRAALQAMLKIPQ